METREELIFAGSAQGQVSGLACVYLLRASARMFAGLLFILLQKGRELNLKILSRKLGPCSETQQNKTQVNFVYMVVEKSCASNVKKHSSKQGSPMEGNPKLIKMPRDYRNRTIEVKGNRGIKRC